MAWKRSYKPKNLMQKRRWRIRIAWMAGFLSAFLVLAALSLWSAQSVYSRLPQAAQLDSSRPGRKYYPSRYDLLVCLTGGRGRIYRALELFDQQQIATYLIISGTNPNSQWNDILKEADWNQPLTRLDYHQRLILDSESSNTIENAFAVASYVRTLNARSILVLTSAYHARRAAFIFKQILPRDIKISFTWIEREPFEANEWWKSSRGIAVTLTEFFKFYFAYFRLRLLNMESQLDLPQ